MFVLLPDVARYRNIRKGNPATPVNLLHSINLLHSKDHPKEENHKESLYTQSTKYKVA